MDGGTEQDKSEQPSLDEPGKNRVEIPFLEPRFVGARFDAHAIPVSVLKDLAALQEMLVETAVDEFYRKNDDRQRVPRGFREAVTVELTGIGSGSARAFLRLVVPIVGLLPLNHVECFLRAPARIVAALSGDVDNVAGIQHLPPKAIKCLERFGQSLRPGESIELSHNGRVASLNNESRRRLLAEAGKYEWMTEGQAVGAICQLNKMEGTFTLLTAEGRKTSVFYNEDDLEVVEQALRSFDPGEAYGKNQLVVVDGVITLDRSNRPLNIESTFVALIPSSEIGQRINEMQQLEAGWFDGEGEKPDAVRLDWLRLELDRWCSMDLIRPYLYPTPDGNVRAEWSLQGHEASLEIDLQHQSGYWHDMDTKSEWWEEASIDLSSPKGWQEVAIRVTAIGRKQSGE